MDKMRYLARKLLSAIEKRTASNDLAILLRELVWLIPILVGCVILSDRMGWDPTFDASTLRLALVAIVIPSLGEELLFRVLLLPQPQPDAPIPKLHAGIALILFVLWHPLQALFATDERSATFLDPWFLIAVGALGFACTRAYWHSGSIWPPVLLHWLAVVGWKGLAGGPAPI